MHTPCTHHAHTIHTPSHTPLHTQVHMLGMPRSHAVTPSQQAKLCVVCLGDEADATVDGCDHSFCSGCILDWCYAPHRQATCPTCMTTCRANICEIGCVKSGNILHSLKTFLRTRTRKPLSRAARAEKFAYVTLEPHGDDGLRVDGTDTTARRAQPTYAPNKFGPSRRYETTQPHLAEDASKRAGKAN